MNPRPWDYSHYLLCELKRGILDVLQRESKERQELTALDFGCGTRPYEPLFHNFGIKYVGANLTGNTQIDISFEAGKTLTLEDEFADIFSSQVLEHVCDVSAYLAENCRLLKPDGIRSAV